MNKIKKTLLLLLVPVFMLSGCLTAKKEMDYGGIFKSIDKGENFLQKVLLSSPQANTLSIGGVNVLSLAIDPQDNGGIYMGTVKSGLFYSYDGAESWNRANDLAGREIDYIAINPDNKCNIYAASNNKIFVTKDCNRTYQEIYNDTRGSAKITKIVISEFNPSIIFMGTSFGDLLRSNDGGRSWANIKNLKVKIQDIAIEGKTDFTIIAGTSKGIYRNRPGEEEWENLSTTIKEQIKGITISLNIKKIILINQDERNNIFVLTEKNIFTSNDAGDNWTALNLITSTRNVRLYSLAVNPLKNNEIYYGTASALIRSFDGGKSWISSKLPSSRIPLRLLVDPIGDNVVYMGMYRIN